MIFLNILSFAEKEINFKYFFILESIFNDNELNEKIRKKICADTFL